jgi:hypothetical protein
MNFFPFTTEKKGSSSQESDDKWFTANKSFPTKEGKKFRARFAVADGATECSFSNIWADILVRDYCNNGHKSAGGLERYIKKLSKKWSQNISVDNLPWYAEEKVKNGAFSTLLGFELEGVRLIDGIRQIKKQMAKEKTPRSGKWSSIAIGDSCLFQIRDKKMIKSFPIEKSTDFNSTPVLLSSNLLQNEMILSSTHTFQGSWKIGDEFFICTDAFAAWFLSESEKNNTPWIEFYDVIENPDPHEKFKSWISKQRESGLMKNDDTTVILIKL